MSESGEIAATAVLDFRVVGSEPDPAPPPAATHVRSVNGRSGDVTLSPGDAGAQAANARLAAVAAGDFTSGLMEWGPSNTVVRRVLGAGASTSVPTLADVDARFARKAAVYAREHGVVGDGVANDYLGMQAALTAAAGGVLVIEAGLVVKTEATLTVPAGTTIMAHGATITKQNGGTHNLLALSTGCRVFGLKLDGKRRNGGGVTGSSAYFEDGDGWVEFHAVHFYDGINASINGCSDALFMGCRFELGRSGIGLGTAPGYDSCKCVRALGCFFADLQHEAIDVNQNVETLIMSACIGTGTPTITGNEPVDIGGGTTTDITISDTIWIVANGGGGVLTKVNGSPLITLRIRLSNLTLIYTGSDNTAGVDITGEDIDADGVTIVGFYNGMTVTGPVSKARLRNIRVRGAGKNGLSVIPGVGAISDVLLEGLDCETSSTTAPCIFIEDGVEGWRLRGSKTTGGISGLRADATATGGSVHDCDFTGTPTGADIRCPDCSLTDIRVNGNGAAGSRGIRLDTTASGAYIGGATRFQNVETDIFDLTDGSTTIVATPTIPDTRYQPFAPALFGVMASPLTAPGEMLAAGLTRTQASGAKATVLGSDGTTWAEAEADAARFYGTARRLRIEGERTNGVRNPRAEGASAGTPGTMPTNWSTVLPSGVTREVVGYSTRNGIPGIELRFSGTATAGNIVIEPETTTGIVAAPSQRWTSSVFAMLVAGTLTGVTSFGIGHTARTSGGASVTGNSTGSGTIGGTMSRLTKTHGLGSDGTIARVQPRIVAPVTATAIDFTVWLGDPGMEQAPFASTPIRPASGSPAASTRGADIVTATLADGASVILADVMIPQAAPAGVDQVVLQLDDGTDANRVAIVNPAGGLTLVVRRTTASSTVSSSSLGSFVAGTPFRIGLMADGAGRAVGRLNSGTMQAVTGAPTSGLTTLRLGNNAAGTSPLNGELGNVLAGAGALHDRLFALLAAAGPVPLRYAQIVGAP